MGTEKSRQFHASSAKNFSHFRFAHCRGHGSATRNLSGVIICPAKRTAVIRRTPSPLANHTFRATEVNLRVPPCSGGKNAVSAGLVQTPPWIPRVAARVQCAGKTEAKKSDSGRERTDRRESETGETPRRTGPSHVRSKCAASPNCRTFRNVRSRHIRWEPPRQKNESRKRGNARDAVLPLLPGNPWHCVCVNGGDCRYGRQGITNSLHPWEVFKKNT
jgi:hypothetical protein